jgi:GTP:adenosylcobinamide-phosphate guanylyltransferase
VSDIPRFTALVLAGSRGPADPVAAQRGLAHKCLVRAGGLPMLARVLDTLLASPWIGEIMVSAERASAILADPDIAWRVEERRVRLVDAAASPSLSVAAALTDCGPPFPVLLTTADHPLLRPEMVAHFCREAAGSGADVVAGLTASAILLARYPASRRTWLRFRDERYSGANLFALMTPAAVSAVAFWRRVEAERKRPWRIARAFGWTALVAYLLGRLTLEDAMARVSRAIGCKAAAVRMPFAEAAIDVDKPADLELVERILAGDTR